MARYFPLDAALELAAAGFAVFPLSHNSKQPLTGSSGVKEASRDLKVVEAAFIAAGESNIGIAPWASEPRMMVVDLDKKPGEDGRATLDELELEHGILPDTLTVETPGGGTHLYFRVPDDAPEISNSVRRIGRGIDVRAAGGYVVAPGSTIDGREYRVVGGELLPHAGAVAMAPVWLISKAIGDFRGGDRERGPVVDLDTPANIDRALKWLQGEARAGRTGKRGQGSNNFTYRTAAVVRDFGISEEACLDLLDRSGWNAACVPPRARDEPAGIVAHVYTYAKRAEGEARAPSPAALDEMAAKVAAKPPEEAVPAEKPARRFRVLEWADLMTMPPPVFMIAGTIVERSIVEIYGPYSSYKSFLAADMALSLAAGVEWARRGISRKYRTCYVAGEGAHGIRQRARAWADAHSFQSVSGFALVPTMPLFGSDADLTQFADDLRPFGPELIVFDTAAHAMAGLDENAAKDTGIFMARCAELRDAFGCTVVLVHHSGKDVNRGSRGSTAIPAAVDTILRVEAPRPLEAVITMEKQKDAEPWKDPQGFKATVVGKSLAFRPEAVMPANTDRIEEVRLEALETILNRMPEGHTITTAPLAAEMASILNPTLDDAGREQLITAIKKWLNRGAKNAPALQPFIAQRAAAGEGGNLWRRPAKQEE